MHMNNVDDLFAELSGNPENFCQWDSAVELTPACTSAEGHDPMRAAVATAAGPSTLLAVGSTPSRAAVIVRDVRRSKQYVPRKELQKRAKQEYIRRIYETADSVEDDHLVFDLQPSSPRLRAELRDSDQHAALNKQLAQQIPELKTWQQLQQFVQEHGDQLNFLNVVGLVTRAAALQQAASTKHSEAAAAAATEPVSLVGHLTVLVLQQSSWFQPTHFAASAVALSGLGVSDPAVWDSLTAAAQHKVGAFTFPQLAATLEALAATGYTPDLSWIERSYRQASKHLHAADAADIAVLMGAWGEMGYTPRDRLFLNQVKINTRREFDQGRLSGAELVQLMHGLARMPRYAPNQGWLAAVTKAAQHHLGDLAPGAVVDLLLSFVALQHTPAEPWMDAALSRIQHAMQTATEQQRSLASRPSNSSSEVSQQQQQELLFLPPLDLEQLAQEQLLLSPGRLLDPAGAQHQQRQQQQQQVMPVEAAELQDLQALFDEAQAESLLDAQQQQQQQLVEVSGPTSRLSSSSSSDALSLRRQLQQQQLLPEHLGILCWCLGRLQFQPDREWMQQLGQMLLAVGPSQGLRPEVVIDVLVGCVATGYLAIGSLQQQLLGQVLQSIPSLPAESLRRSCQALVSLEEGLREWEQQPAALAMLLQAPSSTPAADAASGIAGWLQQYKAELAAAVTRRQGLILSSSNTAQTADVLAFIAAAEQTPSLEYMTAAVTRAVNKLPDGCPTPAVCTLLWALAHMGFKPHPKLLHQLLAALQRGLHLLGSQDLADAGWALCTLRHRPGNTWLSLYMKEVAAKARYMQAQALTDTLWALACFAAQPDREWLKQFVQAAGDKAAAGRLSKQNAAVVVWALQQLGFRPEQLVPAAAGGGSSGAGMAAATVGGVESAVLSLVQVAQQA